jgi:hypothetical protein
MRSPPGNDPPNPVGPHASNETIAEWRGRSPRPLSVQPGRRDEWTYRKFGIIRGTTVRMKAQGMTGGQTAVSDGHMGGRRKGDARKGRSYLSCGLPWYFWISVPNTSPKIREKSTRAPV